ncbi:MAG: hypothetical protein GX442_15450 [Candidatus Riflebacteria bacterium]|nr:hypothetical protein [Candidatus Riflebacteria bacterium]
MTHHPRLRIPRLILAILLLAATGTVATAQITSYSSSPDDPPADQLKSIARAMLEFKKAIAARIPHGNPEEEKKLDVELASKDLPRLLAARDSKVFVARILRKSLADQIAALEHLLAGDPTDRADWHLLLTKVSNPLYVGWLARMAAEDVLTREDLLAREPKTVSEAVALNCLFEINTIITALKP